MKKATITALMFIFGLSGANSLAKDYSFLPFNFDFEKVDIVSTKFTTQQIVVVLPEKVQKLLKLNFPDFRLPQTQDIQLDSEWVSFKEGWLWVFQSQPRRSFGWCSHAFSNSYHLCRNFI